MHVESFPPVADPQATTLILGSMPGKASLAAQQYYAHPRNAFWPIMGRLLDFPADLGYRERCAAYRAAGFALWDVMKACFRSSSLDSDIIESSVIPNDFEAFFSEHPGIRRVFFNGAKAEQAWRRHVKPLLPAASARLELCRLPSTSPANASLNLERKYEEWRAQLCPAGGLDVR